MDPTTFDQIVAGWRAMTDTTDNPAGPLYRAGDYAEADIAMTGDPWSRPARRARDCMTTGSVSRAS